MRTHKHSIGEHGDFWKLDLTLSDYVEPSLKDMEVMWKTALEDCMPWPRAAKTLVLEVVYSIISLHKEKRSENKKGVRLSQWHIHVLIYADGYDASIIASALKTSWLKVVNNRSDWLEKVKAGKKKDGTWKQGCHTIVASESAQKDGYCYDRGRVAYMMWQALKKHTYAWHNGKETKIPFSEVLRRLKLATREKTQKRSERQKSQVAGYWIEWARNVKVALSNIPSDVNPYRMADLFARVIHDAKTGDKSLSDLRSKITKIPDINTPAQWKKVYTQLVRNLGNKGVRGLIGDDYRAILDELNDTKPLLGDIGNVTGTIHFYADGTLSVDDANMYEIEKDEIAKLSRSDKESDNTQKV